MNRDVIGIRKPTVYHLTAERKEGAILNKTRIEWVDLVKGAAIVAVMLGHVDWGENPLCIWLYSFHMPVWFFLSGILAFYSRGTARPALSEYVRKKASGLLYPYFTFSLISIAYLTVFIGFGREIVLLLAAMASLLGISGAMWFLPVMFFSSVLFEALGRIRAPKALLLGILLLLIFLGDRYTPFEYYYAVQRVLISVSFIYLGYFFEMLSDLVREKKGPQLLAGAGLMLAGALLSGTNGLVDLHYGTMNNMFRYYSLALLGCAGLSLIGRNLTLPERITAPLRFLGRNSLIILATHVNLPFISWSRSLYALLAGADGLGNRYADDLVILLILLLFEAAVITLVNRFGKWLLHPQYLKNSK